MRKKAAACTNEAVGTTTKIGVVATSSNAAALTTGLAAAGAVVCGSTITGIVAASVDEHAV